MDIKIINCPRNIMFNRVVLIYNFFSFFEILYIFNFIFDIFKCNTRKKNVMNNLFTHK